MSTISSRYATALFDLAKEENNIDSWQQQIRTVRQLFTKEKELKLFLNHYNISNDEKKSLLNKVFHDSLDKSLYNFICLLIDKKRISSFEEIATDFISLCNSYKNVEEGIVYSIKELDNETIKKIENAVSKKYNKKIELINKLDLNLISGIKVIIGDEVIDGSMKNRIENLREELLEKAGKIL